MDSKPRTLRNYIVGHCLIGTIFLGGIYLLFVRSAQRGSDLTSRRAAVESQKPDLLLVGDSVLRAAIDPEEFSRLSGLATQNAHSDGSASLWWYLYVKNVAVSTAHRPKYVGIMFRDAFLTEPRHRATSIFQKPIRRLMTDDEPLAERLSYAGMGMDQINSPFSWVPREARNWLNLEMEKRVEDILKVGRTNGRPAFQRVFAEENMIPGQYTQFQLGYEHIDNPSSFEFASRVDQSYLPHIIGVLSERGITPVFIRAKRRRDLDPAAEPPELKSYVADLQKYVAQRGALWIDLTHEDSIRPEHFGAGDHLNRKGGRQTCTRLLADRLAPLMSSTVAMRNQESGKGVKR
jgi:hypothetical protein